MHDAPIQYPMVQSVPIVNNQSALDPTRSSAASSEGDVPDSYVDWHYILGGSRTKTGRSMPSLISVSNSNNSEICLSNSGGASWPGVESISDINETSILYHPPTTITLDGEEYSMPDLASVSSTEAESDSSGLDYVSKLPNRSGLDTHAPILTTPNLTGGGDKGASSSTNGSVIEVSDYEGVDAPVFNAQEWIGCGKIWSDPMPVEVCAARSAARRIPDGITPAFIPDTSVSVLDLLAQSVQCSRSVDMAKYDTALPNTLIFI